MPAPPRGYWFNSFILYGWNTWNVYRFFRLRRGRPTASITIRNSDNEPFIIPTPDGMMILCELMLALDKNPDLREATLGREQVNALVSKCTMAADSREPLEVVNELAVARCDYYSPGSF